MEPADIRRYLLRAVTLSREGMSSGRGGPFGCVIVRDEAILSEGYNQVLSDKDPTAHAEIVAIREACRRLGSFQLEGCFIFSSCEPCPMCLGAIYWARPEAVYYVNSRAEAADAGFDDAFIYEQIVLPEDERSILFIRVPLAEGVEVFREWVALGGRGTY
jgi:tRNA(Arg) A34 adenosine deaminase TadA